MKISIAILFVLFGCTPAENATDYSVLVETLSAKHSREEALAAHQKIVAAGKQAFPALLNRLNDDTVTHVEFLGSVSTIAPPPLGQVCYEILQGQIEGRWLMSFQSYRILNGSNIAQWIDEHSSKSLAEMRLAALNQAIVNVESQSEANLEAKYAKNLLDFLAEKKMAVENPTYDFNLPEKNPFE